MEVKEVESVPEEQTRKSQGETQRGEMLSQATSSVYVTLSNDSACPRGKEETNKTHMPNTVLSFSTH